MSDTNEKDVTTLQSTNTTDTANTTETKQDTNTFTSSTDTTSSQKDSGSTTAADSSESDTVEEKADDNAVKLSNDLSKTINENFPKFATQEYVRQQIQAMITSSKELQTTLEGIRDSMSEDNVDKVLKSLGKYLPLAGGTITGDLEVLGKLRGHAESAEKAYFTEKANQADRADRADKADVATTAQNCLGNALTADKATYAARAAVADRCTGNAATADVATKARSIDSIDWNIVKGAPTKYPADGGNADTATTASSVEWTGVKNAPAFLTEVHWKDIQGVPPTAEATTIAWENVTGKPVSMPADGGIADSAKSVDWANIQNKPADKVIKWDDVTQKPDVRLKSDKVDWTLDIANKPQYYPVKSVTWEQVTGKPETYPNHPVDYGDLLNVPKTFATTWDLVSGKPDNFVFKEDAIDKAKHADEATTALNLPTKDVGGNIWIVEN